MASATLKSFGRRVRELRTAAGFSQESLGEAIGLHRNYIGGIERGERNVALLNIAAIARALKVPASQLVTGVDDARGRQRVTAARPKSSKSRAPKRV